MTLRDIKRFQRVRPLREIYLKKGKYECWDIIQGFTKVTDKLYEGWTDKGSFNYVPAFDGEEWLDEEVAEYKEVPKELSAAEKAKWENMFKLISKDDR